MADPPSDTFNFYISDWNDAPDCATLFCVHTYNCDRVKLPGIL